jgi:hypothetical protein
VAVMEVVYHWAAASVVWPLMVVSVADNHSVDSEADLVVYHLLEADSAVDMAVDSAVDSAISAH